MEKMEKVLCDENAIAILDELTNIGVSTNFTRSYPESPLNGLTVNINFAGGTSERTVDLEELLQAMTMYLTKSEVEDLKIELHSIANNIVSYKEC